MPGSARSAPIGLLQPAGLELQGIVDAHQVLTLGHVEGAVQAAVMAVLVARFDLVGGDAPAQILPKQVRRHLFRAVLGEHHQFVRLIHRLPDAVQDGTQPGDSVTGEDDDARVAHAVP